MKYVVSLREYYESGESLVFGTDNLLEAENYALFCAIGHLDDHLTYLYEVSEKPKLLCSFSAEKNYTLWATSGVVVLKSIDREVYNAPSQDDCLIDKEILLDGYKKILASSDLEMRDGDLARDIAADILGVKR